MKDLGMWLVFPLLAFAGCTMIPEYSTPAPPVGDTWPEGAPITPDAGSAASIAWHEFFQSPELRRVLRTAVAHNRDLRIAGLRIEEARGLYRIERSDLFPHLDLAGSGRDQKIPDAASPFGEGSGGLRISTYEANVAVNAFELDLFGRLRSQNRAALEEYFAVEETRDALQLALIAETANAYLQWLADRELLSVAEETLGTQTQSLELITARFENGLASELDLAQVRTAVESARVSQSRFARRVAQDRNALAVLMGSENPDSLSVTSRLGEVELMKNLPVGLPSEVLLLRPDIRAAEHDLKAENARIGAARAAFFPRISLTGSYGFASSELTQLFAQGALGAWSFIPQISTPIFQAGRNRANLRVAHVRKNMAVAEYERSLQTAFREVADELAAKETLETQLTAQRNLVQANANAYNLSYARYKSGVDSFLNVLDAQRALFNARQNEIDIQRQRLANLVNLYKALGGGSFQLLHADNQTAP